MDRIPSNWTGELWTLKHADADSLVPPRDEFLDNEHEPALLFASEADARRAADCHAEHYDMECVPLKLRDALS